MPPRASAAPAPPPATAPTMAIFAPVDMPPRATVGAGDGVDGGGVTVVTGFAAGVGTPAGAVVSAFSAAAVFLIPESISTISLIRICR